MSIFSGEFTSKTINKNVTIRVIFPDSPFDLECKDNELKTMYLLHGGGGSSNDWPRFTKIEFYAKLYNFTVVMADAGTSFYSDMCYGGDYISFFTDELPKELEKKFHIPQKTFICGQSMGGYGSLKIGLSNPGRYAGIGVLSGATNIHALIDMKNESLISRKTFEAIWGENIVLNQKDDLKYLAKKATDNKTTPKIIHCCGTEDFLYKYNIDFHNYLNEIRYNNVYWESPGTHMWDYWDREIPKVMEEMCKL